MKEELNNHRMDSELEARIVALVLGEASELEREQLSRLIEERPELAAFESEIEAAHRLMSDVGRSNWPANEKDWKLSPEKRDVVLAVIRGESSQTTTPSSSKPAIFQFLAKDKARWNLLRIAAAVCGAGVFGLLAMAAFLFSRTSRVAHNTGKQIGLGLHSYHDAYAEAPASSSGTVWMLDGASRSEGFGDSGAESAAVTPQPEYVSNSKSALSDIRVNLGTNADVPNSYGLQNNVSSFSSGAKFNLPADSPELPGVLAGDNESGEKSVRGQLAFESSEFKGYAVTVPELAQEIQEHTVKELGEQGGVASSIVRILDGAKTESEAKPASPGKPASPSFGVQESAPAPVAAEPRSRFRRGETFDANGAEVTGKAIDGFDVDNNSNGVADGVWVDGRTPRIMIPENEEKAQNGYFGNAKVDGETQMAGDQPIEAGSRGGVDGDKQIHDFQINLNIAGGTVPSSGLPDVGGSMRISGDEMGGRQPAARSGAIDMDGRFKKEGIFDDGVDEFSYSNGKLPPLSLTPKAAISSPQDAQRLDNFSGRVTSNGEREWQDERPLKGVLEQEVVRKSKSAEKSLGGVAIEKKSEVAEVHKDIQTKRSTMRGTTFFDQSLLGDARQWQERSLRRLDEKGKAIEKTRETKAVAAAGLIESKAADNAFSTFSLHVSDVSFKLAQAALARGEWPEAAKVRIEEFVNAFDYGDPMPSDDEKVACRVEQSIHPFLQQRNLLRVSMRTAAAGRASSTPLRITFLLDNSGSMERIDRQQTVRSAFALLAQQLTPIDQVTLISFARQPRLLADKVNGAQSKQLVDLIDDLPSEGGTNLEAALKLAMEKATEQQLEGAQNRIVLLTDGAVNLGDANPESLSVMITAMRDAGIAFDAAGISAEGLNDEVLEALTRKGDGRYYLLDSVEAADDGFVRQIAGALRPSAKNVKVQVEFNPKRVGQYKLLGYEKHLLKQEDFRNDNVDAAEMAAAEAGVAVYQFESLPNGEGDVGSVSVRFRDLSTGEMIENRWPIPYEANPQRTDQAAPSMCIATSAALFAAKLRGEPLGEAVDLKTLTELLAGLPEQDRNAKRVQQLQSMINQALQVGGNP